MMGGSQATGMVWVGGGYFESHTLAYQRAICACEGRKESQKWSVKVSGMERLPLPSPKEPYEPNLALHAGSQGCAHPKTQGDIPEHNQS